MRQVEGLSQMLIALVSLFKRPSKLDAKKVMKALEYGFLIVGRIIAIGIIILGFIVFTVMKAIWNFK